MTEGATSWRERVRRMGVLALVLLPVTAVAATTLLRYQPLEQSGDLRFGADTQVQTVPGYDVTGVHVLRYVHDKVVSYSLTVRNSGPLPITVAGVELPPQRERRLLQPVAFGLPGNGSADADDMQDFEAVSLAPGAQQQIVIQARFDNCEYYTERAIETVDRQVVDFLVAGLPRKKTIHFERPLLVRSPTINRCEDRTLDRSENRRTDPEN